MLLLAAITPRVRTASDPIVKEHIPHRKRTKSVQRNGPLLLLYFPSMAPVKGTIIRGEIDDREDVVDKSSSSSLLW
jgi:hypothetical protein